MKTQIMCEIWRGSYLESVHSGTAVICDFINFIPFISKLTFSGV